MWPGGPGGDACSEGGESAAVGGFGLGTPVDVDEGSAQIEVGAVLIWLGLCGCVEQGDGIFGELLAEEDDA